MASEAVCVVMLGLTFLLIFTAFQTQGNMQQTVIKSISAEDPSFPPKGGYTSLAIVYGVFAAANWIAPSVLAILGPKITIFAGGVSYALFVASFLIPHGWLLYLVSVLVGLGAAIIWTAQGNYLTLASTKDTMSRNSGIFWAMLQCSMVFGNVFVFVKFQGQDIIDSNTRLLVYIVLSVICASGCVLCLFLPKPTIRAQSEEQEGGAGVEEKPTSPKDELLKSFELFRTRKMGLLMVTFLYTGFELSFFSGIYSTCLSSTLLFADPKSLVGLSGICVGVGEIVGGATFGIFGSWTNKIGRDPIVMLGYVIHMVSFFLIFLNIPQAAPLMETYDTTYFPDGLPIMGLALFCSVMLGFGDACFNTQIFSILGSVYSENSGPAFALFKFTQSLSAAICFVYSSYADLYTHLGILVVSGTVGTLTFCLVEWEARKKAVEIHEDEAK